MQFQIKKICIYFRSVQEFSTLPVKYYRETNLTKSTVMKQSNGLNGDLKLEYKNITNITPATPAGRAFSRTLFSPFMHELTRIVQNLN